MLFWYWKKKMPVFFVIYNHLPKESKKQIHGKKSKETKITRTKIILRIDLPWYILKQSYHLIFFFLIKAFRAFEFTQNDLNKNV